MPDLSPASSEPSQEPRALLCVLSQPASDDLAEFHCWYDEEHVPARVVIPGIRTAARFQRVEGELPDWLAVYDVDAPEVLQRPDYRILREQRSPREQAVIDRLQVLDRRIYRRLSSVGTAPDGAAAFLLANWMSPPADRLEEFHHWYDDEHIPLLLEGPEWLRSRRYELVEGDGPRFLALHDLASLSAFDSPSYRQAGSTPLRRRVIGHLQARQRALFRRYRDFTPAGRVS